MRQPDEGVLLDMLLFARRIRDRMRHVTREEFDADEDLQYALIHLIQVVGEAASRSDEALRLKYPELPWSDMIGMRHRIVHDYLHVSVDVVWETATNDIPPLVDLLDTLTPQDEAGST